MPFWFEEKKGSPRRISLTKTLTVGRVEGDLRFEADERLSRSHVRFSEEANDPWVEDLGSRNGTFLNGTKLVPGRRSRLKVGDEIKFGSKKWVLRESFGKEDAAPSSGAQRTSSSRQSSSAKPPGIDFFKWGLVLCGAVILGFAFIAVSGRFQKAKSSMGLSQPPAAAPAEAPPTGESP